MKLFQISKSCRILGDVLIKIIRLLMKAVVLLARNVFLQFRLAAASSVVNTGRIKKVHCFGGKITQLISNNDFLGYMTNLKSTILNDREFHSIHVGHETVAQIIEIKRTVR